MKFNYNHSNVTKTLIFFLFSISCIILKAQNNRWEVSSSFQGCGKQSDPYLITSAADLRLLSDNVESGNVYRDCYFRMTQDITFNKNVLNDEGELNVLNARSHEEWKPIGHGRFPFCGIFDGDGHTIYGLYHGDVKKDSVALFGYFDGKVRNLTIKDSYLSGKNVAGFVCYTLSSNEVCPKTENCHSFVRILASEFASGVCLCRDNSFQYLNKCSNHGIVEGVRCTGISYSGYGKLYNCVNYGKIIGSLYASGIAATMRGGLQIGNCINKGIVRGKKACAISGSTGNYGQGIYLCVNTGYCYGTESYICDGGAGAHANYCYYLEFSADKDCRLYKFPESDLIRKRTESQLKSVTFLQELNSNRVKLDFGSGINVNPCYWIEDQDGYPTLDFIADLALAINDKENKTEKMALSYYDGKVLTVKNASPNKMVTAMSITGQVLATQKADKEGVVQFTNLSRQHNIVLLKTEKTTLKVLLHK